ncbi:MAG: hypothetical protein ACE5J9_05155 [Methanosarcinales archaeon]
MVTTTSCRTAIKTKSDFFATSLRDKLAQISMCITNFLSMVLDEIKELRADLIQI